MSEIKKQGEGSRESSFQNKFDAFSNKKLEFALENEAQALEHFVRLENSIPKMGFEETESSLSRHLGVPGLKTEEMIGVIRNNMQEIMTELKRREKEGIFVEEKPANLSDKEKEGFFKKELTTYSDEKLILTRGAILEGYREVEEMIKQTFQSPEKFSHQLDQLMVARDQMLTGYLIVNEELFERKQNSGLH